MKLAFTTLGCPEWDMGTIIAKAVEYGFDGVDFRGYQGELNVYELPRFTNDVKDTARQFADAGLDVSCFSSSVCVFLKTPAELNAGIDEVKAYAELCTHFQTPFIRVFGGAIGDTPRADAVDIMAANLEQIAEVTGKYGVQPLLETHDEWLECAHLKAVMEKVDPDSAGILWDVHHPYRMKGESPLETWTTLGRWIRNTHWKDSRVQQDLEAGYQLCLTGDGDIPLTEIFECLKNGDYKGYLTLEWEKMWHPEIEEAEIAFPKYVEFMCKMIQ